jgi:hypothetical protein
MSVAVCSTALTVNGKKIQRDANRERVAEESHRVQQTVSVLMPAEFHQNHDMNSSVPRVKIPRHALHMRARAR